MLENQFSRYRDQIKSYLEKYFTNDPLSIKTINPFGADVLNRIKEFSMNGKMIRGSLILFTSEMFLEGETDVGLEPASAMEIIHSSLLIHDDIMDRDTMRRGLTTMHHQYALDYSGSDPEDSLHYGESMAICAGDIGFFIGFNILTSSRLPKKTLIKIFQQWSREFTYVGVAQMEDIYFGSIKSDKKISAERIIDLYRYKTSRYTFSLPFVTGALISDQNKFCVEKLHKLGELMGIIFQIKDDELGLFGDEKITGKPVGSDIQEGKKTLYIKILKDMTQNSREKELINEIIEGRDASPEKIEILKEISEKNGVIKKLESIINDTKENCSRIIESLNIKSHYKNILYSLLEFTITRNR